MSKSKTPKPGSQQQEVRLTISAHNLARLKWCIELCERIEPGNCAHIAANIRGSLRHVVNDAGEPNNDSATPVR